MHEFDLIGDVGYEINAQAIKQMLASAKGEDVTFYIATMGGDLDQGVIIYNLLKKYSGKTTGVIIGHTASAGTIIISGCDTIQCNSNSPFLVHNSSDTTGGNAVELEKRAVDLRRLDKMMLAIYKAENRIGLNEEKLVELMNKSDWITPGDAKEYGFIDEVITNDLKAVAYCPTGKTNIQLLTKLKNQMGLFNKSKADKGVLNVLAMADGSQLVINAEAAAEDVEVSPVGAATLEDGEYELADGSKITVAGGIITNVEEKAAEAAEEEEDKETDTEAVVAAVSAIVVAEVEKLRVEFKADLAKVSSTHKPAKKTTVTARAETSVESRIKTITDKIKSDLNKKIKA